MTSENDIAGKWISEPEMEQHYNTSPKRSRHRQKIERDKSMTLGEENRKSSLVIQILDEGI